MRLKSEMKRIVIVVMLMFASVGIYAGNDSEEVGQEILDLIGEYGRKDSIDVFQLGSLGTAAVKTMIRTASAFSDDKDMQDAMKVFKGIRRIAVVDYSRCGDAVRDSFERRLGRLLKDCEMLGEAKDGDDEMCMYGVYDEKSENVSNFILHCKSDCALVCLFGTIKLDAIADVVSE